MIIYRHDGFTLIELVVIIAILAILSAILIPMVGSFVNRSYEQVDVAHARLLLLSTTIAFGADDLSNGTYTAGDDGSSPLPYRELLGPTWPVAKIGNNYFIVDVDFSRDVTSAVQVIRIVNGVSQVYQTHNGTFK